MKIIIATYIKKQTKEFEVDNPFDASNQAEAACPEGYKLLDWKYAIPCDHPRSERDYLGRGLLKCNLCGEEFE